MMHLWHHVGGLGSEGRPGRAVWGNTTWFQHHSQKKEQINGESNRHPQLICCGLAKKAQMGLTEAVCVIFIENPVFQAIRDKDSPVFSPRLRIKSEQSFGKRRFGFIWDICAVIRKTDTFLKCQENCVANRYISLNSPNCSMIWKTPQKSSSNIGHLNLWTLISTEEVPKTVLD